jgi:pyruvate,water dikinase
MLGRLFWTLLRPEAQRAKFEEQLQVRLAQITAGLAHDNTLAERVAQMEVLISRTYVFVLPRFVPCFWAGMVGLGIVNYLARQVSGGEEYALIATRGLPHNVTTQMSLALWGTAQVIRRDRASRDHFLGSAPENLAAEYVARSLPETAQAAVASFLARYGMRGVGEIDLGRPRWHEDPVPVMKTLHTYLSTERPEKAPDVVFERGEAEAKAAINRLAYSVRQTRGGWLKAWLLRWAARRMRALTGLREAPKFWAMRVWGVVRAALLESGQALCEEGLLQQADDLFYLPLPELKSLANGQQLNWPQLVADRRQTHAREMRRTQIPRLLLSDGQAFYEGLGGLGELVPPTGGRDILTGVPVSPGVAEGPVRIVFDPHHTPLALGEILVCRGTDPAWTPLFLIAGGLVTEVGGLMTHGSVVAREYGIPAVVGVSQATRRFRNGQRVRIDGGSGQILVLEEERG